MSRIALTIIVAAVVFGASAAHAAFKTEQCLAAKVKAAGILQKCRTTEEAKQLLSKPADPAKCQTKFQDTLAKLDTKAAKAGIGCRYRGNGDGTVTDFDTGLQWEKKGALDDSPNLSDPHDADNTYTWSFGIDPDGTVFTDFLGELNDCESHVGSTVIGGFVGHCDWRLPTIIELQSISDLSAPGCGSGSPCIDATAFGPTVAAFFWSSITAGGFPDRAWIVGFNSGGNNVGYKSSSYYVRAVRGGL
jgi:hypothetical protein